MTAHYHCLLLKHKKDKTHKKNNKKEIKRREGTYLQALTLPSHFWLPLPPFYFKCFLLASSCSQVEKKNRKTIEKKRNAKKGGNFPSNSHSVISFLGLASTFPFLPFCFKCFLLFSSRIEKKKKKCKERRELIFKLSLYLFSFLVFGFGLLFLPFHFKHFLRGIFLSRKKKIKKHKEKTIYKEKNSKKGGSLPFFSHFCIWDKALFLLSPFHIPSTLSSPPSSSLVSHVFSKLCASQARELPRALEMEWAKNEMMNEKWGEGGRREDVGRRGKFWGKEGSWKICGQGKRMCFWFISKTVWTALSWTGALLAAGSLQPHLNTSNF